MKHNFSFCISIIFVVLFHHNVFSQNKPEKSVCDYVNPFIGTQEMGHTFPGALVPFGMVQLSPETDTVSYEKNGKYNPDVYRYCAGYQYTDKTICGFSHTHLSGTGHSDLGDFLIMPVVGKIFYNSGIADKPRSGYRSRFSRQTENASPGYYKVKLDDYSVLAELTATTRVGFHQYTFPKTDSAHIILDMNAGIYNYEGKVLCSSVRVENDTLVTGYRITCGWARTRYIYFAMSFSKPIENYSCLYDKNIIYKGFWRKFNQNNNFPEMAGKNLKLCFDFSTDENEKIKIKVAISAVSCDGALKNLIAETPDWDFDNIKTQARIAWENELNKIKINASDNKKIIFYTSLYHASMHPNIYSDIDGNYRGLDNNIHHAENFTNYTVFSLWDTYRALHPLLTITNQQRVNDMINSMLAHYQQSVHKMLPVWSHHANENWCMIGYHAVSVIADAYLKGINRFDVNLAYKACVATATSLKYDAIGDYIHYGFVPDECNASSASITLEYAYDDFTIAQLAKSLKKIEESVFFQRASNYSKLFDKSSGFIRAKNKKGIWKTPFNPLKTSGEGFIEGNSWNYSLYVPHDIKGYIKLLGGQKRLISRLDSLFTMHLSDENFAETEDVTRVGMIGNYVHGNEPSHHVAYMYAWTDEPWKTQERVHLIMNKMYRNATDGLCGNDDCGQMSAWYIFSALGFFPVAPATNQYVFGSPFVDEAIIKLDNNKTFKIKANGLSDKNIYIQSITLNGKPYHKTYISHHDIVSGGELIFNMGNKPNKNWGIGEENKPFSLIK